MWFLSFPLGPIVTLLQCNILTCVFVKLPSLPPLVSRRMRRAPSPRAFFTNTRPGRTPIRYMRARSATALGLTRTDQTVPLRDREHIEQKHT